MAAVWEGKKYKMEKSEGFDDYMKALGKCSVRKPPSESVKTGGKRRAACGSRVSSVIGTVISVALNVAQREIVLK